MLITLFCVFCAECHLQFPHAICHINVLMITIQALDLILPYLPTMSSLISSFSFFTYAFAKHAATCSFSNVGLGEKRMISVLLAQSVQRPNPINIFHWWNCIPPVEGPLCGLSRHSVMGQSAQTFSNQKACSHHWRRYVGGILVTVMNTRKRVRVRGNFRGGTEAISGEG